MTTPGTMLLAGGTLTALLATVLLAIGYVRRENRFETYVTRLVAASATLFVTALTLLTYQFVTTDYSNAYVWHNTANYLPLLNRITGVYASNAGSFLLWATIAALVVAWATWRRGLDEVPAQLVAALTTGTVTYFGTLLVLDSPFTPISTVVSGGVPTTGTGINPLLIDPYMAIHPPLMFTAYALLTMPFAIGVAHFVGLFCGDGALFEQWYGSVTKWLRASWLFLTAALSLGALWSYTVLGWGGIWAWDPVETAIFIPWLFLTATLHAVVNYDPDEQHYSVLAPAMTASTFALAIYTTTVVRSGVFRSVHSFADAGAGTGLLVFMGVTALLGVGLPLGYWLVREESTSESDAWLTESTLLHGAVLALGLLAFISLWGLTFPVLRDLATGIEVEVGARYYNRWSFPVTLLTLLLLGFYMDYDVEGRRRSLAGLGVFGAATVIAALYAPSPTWRLGAGSPQASGLYAIVGQMSALSVFPPVAYVCMAVVKRGLDRIPGRPRRVQLKQTGIVLIHVGVAVLVFSLAFTYLFTAQSSVVVSGTGGGRVDVPDSPYAVRPLQFDSYSLPKHPNVDRVALSTTALRRRGQATNNTTQVVHGTVTDIRRGPRATVYQLDESGIWVGVSARNGTADARFARGDDLVARGAVMWNYVPQTDAVVVTGPSNVGPVDAPPESLGLERVRVRSTTLAVYQGSHRIAVGQAAQRRYPQQGGMQTRDVLIHRGLTHDTYVIAAVQGDTASITVKRIPLMTPLRLSVVSLLVGMALVFLFDPTNGVWTRPLAPRSEPDSEPTTSD